jgi:hypothetical protein
MCLLIFMSLKILLRNSLITENCTNIQEITIEKKSFFTYKCAHGLLSKKRTDCKITNNFNPCPPECKKKENKIISILKKQGCANIKEIKINDRLYYSYLCRHGIEDKVRSDYDKHYNSCVNCEMCILKKPDINIIYALSLKNKDNIEFSHIPKLDIYNDIVEDIIDDIKKDKDIKEDKYKKYNYWMNFKLNLEDECEKSKTKVKKMTKMTKLKYMKIMKQKTEIYMKMKYGHVQNIYILDKLI